MLRIRTVWNANKQHLKRVNSYRFNSTDTVVAQPGSAEELLYEKDERKPAPRLERSNEFFDLKKALADRNFTKITELFRSYNSDQMLRLSSFGLPSRLFREVYRQNRSQSAVNGLTVNETVNKLLDNGVATGWIAGMSIIADISAGNTGRALETWVRFVETRGSPIQAVSEINREAAIAALAAYIVDCHNTNQPIDCALAMKLIPLDKSKEGVSRLPLANEIYQIHGADLLSPETRQIIDKGLKVVRMEFMDPSSTDFLLSLPTDRPIELDQKYAEAREKCAQTGQHLSEVAYARFISCYTLSTRVKTAFEIWNTMLSEGIRPGVSSWTALLRAGAMSRVPTEKRVAIVEDLWKKMISQKNPTVQPNSESFAVLLDCYFRMNEFEKALAVFRRIEKGSYGPGVTVSIRIFNVVLNGLLSAGKLPEAEELLVKGEKQGLSSDAISYNTFMRSYIAQGRTEKAIELLHHMGELKIQPDITTYANVIDAIFKMVRYTGKESTVEAKVDKLLREMNTLGIKSNTITITTIIRGLLKSCNDIEAARVMFDLMLRKRISPNTRTFSIIIDGEFTCDNGKPEKAVQYLNMMPLYGVPQSTPILNQFIHYFALHGELKTAYGYLERLCNRLGSANKYSFYFVLRGCLQENDMVMASKVVNELLVNVPDTFHFGDRIPLMILELEKNGVQMPKELIAKVAKSE